MKRKKISGLLSTSQRDIDINVYGWVRTRRDSKGGFSFIEIYDGSCFKGIQIIADSSLPNYEQDIQKLSAGCAVFVQGMLVESLGSGQSVEVQAKKIDVLGFADPEKYPLQKKRHSFEFLRQIAHLRPRTNTFGAVSRVRSALSYAIHSFFQENNFHYIHTPIITGSDCEGAGEMFRVTTLNLEQPPKKNGQVDYSHDFFAKASYLTVSGQLEAEIYALALGNVYTFGPTFRAENSNTSRHLAEFWMVEPEMAFCDLKEDAETAENFLKYIIKHVLINRKDDMEFFNKFIDKSIIEKLENIISSEFIVLSYTEAVKILKSSKFNFSYPVQWGHNLQAEHERYLAQTYCRAPVVLIDFPKEIKPFYMRCNDDNKTVAAMDILFPAIGEIIGGSQREERYDILKNNMIEKKLNLDEYWWYLELREYGTVPHAGFGLGFDRLIQFVTGMGNIRDVIAFARTPKNADF
ncbi:asparagine--tRNA ligase [bacterium]|nr:asparagine--tRNA ligase [bacterium]